MYPYLPVWPRDYHDAIVRIVLTNTHLGAALVVLRLADFHRLGHLRFDLPNVVGQSTDSRILDLVGKIDQYFARLQHFFIFFPLLFPSSAPLRLARRPTGITRRALLRYVRVGWLQVENQQPIAPRRSELTRRQPRKISNTTGIGIKTQYR